jgi:anthranilate synthase component 1
LIGKIKKTNRLKPPIIGGFFVFMKSFTPPNFEQFLTMTDKASVVPIVHTLPADLLTPLAAYLKISISAKHSFLLESVEGGENLARYSFLGANPFMIADGDFQKTKVSRNGANEILDVPFFQFLREHFDKNDLYFDINNPVFTGGAIGYFGFSAVEWFEPTLKQPRQTDNNFLPESLFMFYRTIVAFDHARQLIKIISLVFTEESEGNAEKLETLYKNAVSQNETLIEKLESENFSYNFKTQNKVSDSEVRSNWEKEDFKNAVGQIKELIAAGECYQVVLSQCFSRQTTASPVSIYRALRSLNPSPYMFLLQIEENAVIGASPEMLVRSRARKLEYHPIAGTRGRGKTAEEDNALAEEMKVDEKELAEHLMLVDLGRNDLGRVAEFGSVKVEKLLAVEKYSHVQHLVSRLTAELREEFDCFDALASCFPAGTVTGAPKVRAVEIIQKIEPTSRGIYSGAIGYIDYARNLDTCIAIRTLVLENGTAKIQAGAGIVADSVPESEYQETVNKARALLKTVEIAESD